MTLSKTIAAAIADDLIARGAVTLKKRSGGIHRVRLINLIERRALEVVGADAADSSALTPEQAVFVHLAQPLVRLRKWANSLPPTAGRDNMIDQIDAALFRAARIVSTNPSEAA